MARLFDLLLGRKTYEIFAAYWATVSEEQGAGPLNKATKYVVSNSLERADWQRSHLIKGDDVAQIQRLKEQDGPELQVHGSANLLQTLIKHHLVDKYNLKIFPVLLGRGKRLLGDGAIPAGLRLVDSKTSTAGVIMATSGRAGAVIPGSFASQPPAA